MYSEEYRMDYLMRRLKIIAAAIKIQENVDIEPLEIMNLWIQDIKGTASQRAEIDRLYCWAVGVIESKGESGIGEPS